jgi:FkbM family methyltransferase
VRKLIRALPWWRLVRARNAVLAAVSPAARADQKIRAIDERDFEAIRQIIRLRLRRDSSAVDIGANKGDILREMVAVAPAGRHVAFEPLPRFAAALRSAFPGVEVHEIALSDRRGEQQFHDVVERPALSGLLLRDDPRIRGEVRTLRVRTARLDDVLPPDRRFDLIKIDVEGVELAVLEGARDVIERCKPDVIFEHGIDATNPTNGPSVRVWRYFDSLGLALFRLDGRGPLSLDDFLAVRDSWNFLARIW